jgi:hypothetical protein
LLHSWDFQKWNISFCLSGLKKNLLNFIIYILYLYNILYSLQCIRISYITINIFDVYGRYLLNNLMIIKYCIVNDSDGVKITWLYFILSSIIRHAWSLTIFFYPLMSCIIQYKTFVLGVLIRIIFLYNIVIAE